MDTSGHVTSAFMISTLCALLLITGYSVYVIIWLIWPWYREQRQPRRLVSVRAELDALDSLDPPTVRPGYLFDHSEAAASGRPQNTCPECYIEDLLREGHTWPRTADGGYPLPKGEPMLCPNHLSTTLANALRRKERTQ